MNIVETTLWPTTASEMVAWGQSTLVSHGLDHGCLERLQLNSHWPVHGRAKAPSPALKGLNYQSTLP